MSKDKTAFVCSDCGGTSPRWLGKCPQCSAWNTLSETVVEPQGARNRYAGASRPALNAAQAVAPLSSIEASDFERTPTGLDELDRVLGGGMVEGAVVLIGGDPGIGKSTAENLLKTFRSVKKVSEASLKDLAKQVGQAKAVVIMDYFERKGREGNKK